MVHAQDGPLNKHTLSVYVTLLVALSEVVRLNDLAYGRMS